MEYRNPEGHREQRLAVGGALLFCSAVLVQLMHSNAHTTALWVAIGSCAVAIPCLVGAFFCVASTNSNPGVVDTRLYRFLLTTGYGATFVSCASLFWSYSWLVGAVFVGVAIVVFYLCGVDYHLNNEINKKGSE